MMLDKVKLALRKTAAVFDDEIEDYITSGIADRSFSLPPPPSAPPEQTLLDGSPTHSPPLFSNSLLTTQLVYDNL